MRRSVILTNSLPRIATALILGLTVLLTAGCGGGARAKTSNDLKALGVMYHEYLNRTKKGPEKAEDLKGESSISPEAYQGLSEGRYVLIYGVTLTDMTNGSSNTVLAYEQAAPTNGGWVLFGDGSVRQLSPQDFKTAPKAKRPGSGETK